MKMKFNLILLFGFFSVFLILQPLSVFAELIEPSRTLEGQQKSMGRLSVFSDPPELDVLLERRNWKNAGNFKGSDVRSSYIAG